MPAACLVSLVLEDLINLLLFFEITVTLADTHVLLLPVLCANGVSAGLNDDSFESFNASSHLHVQLLLHGVDVELNVLSDAS